MKKMRQKRKGFTLIELLIVVAIIGILAAIAIPNFLGARTKASVAKVFGDMDAIMKAEQMYLIDHDKYTTNSATLTEDASAYLNSVPRCPFGDNVYRIHTSASDTQVVILCDGPHSAGTGDALPLDWDVRTNASIGGWDGVLDRNYYGISTSDSTGGIHWYNPETLGVADTGILGRGGG